MRKWRIGSLFCLCTVVLFLGPLPIVDSVSTSQVPSDRVRSVLGVGTAFGKSATRGRKVKRSLGPSAFRGKILTSKKAFPSSAKSKKAYIKKLKKIRTSKFWENIEKKKWKIHFIAFFKRPLGDVEVTIKLFDMTEKGKRRMITSFEQYLSEKGQTSFRSHLSLSREEVGVNRQVSMVIENRGKPLAKTTFKLFGKTEKRSGKVNFTEEETKQ